MFWGVLLVNLSWLFWGEVLVGDAQIARAAIML